MGEEAIDSRRFLPVADRFLEKILQHSKARRQNSEDRKQKGDTRMMRQPAKDFQDLIVWQKAHQFVLSIYRFSGLFPKNEIYGLTSQTRRSAVSIPAKYLPC
jgi:hypothetical protein